VSLSRRLKYTCTVRLPESPSGSEAGDDEVEAAGALPAVSPADGAADGTVPSFRAAPDDGAAAQPATSPMPRAEARTTRNRMAPTLDLFLDGRPPTG
jgi:hypothetical protein